MENKSASRTRPIMQIVAFALGTLALLGIFFIGSMSTSAAIPTTTTGDGLTKPGQTRTPMATRTPCENCPTNTPRPTYQPPATHEPYPTHPPMATRTPRPATATPTSVGGDN